MGVVVNNKKSNICILHNLALKKRDIVNNVESLTGYIGLGVAHLFVGFFFVSIYYTFLSYEFNHFIAITIEKYPLPPINLPEGKLVGKLVWRPFSEQVIHVVQQYDITKWEFYKPMFDLVTGKSIISTKTAVLLYPESVSTRHFWAQCYSNLSLLSGTAFIVSIIIALN